MKSSLFFTALVIVSVVIGLSQGAVAQIYHNTTIMNVSTAAADDYAMMKSDYYSPNHDKVTVTHKLVRNGQVIGVCETGPYQGGPPIDGIHVVWCEFLDAAGNPVQINANDDIETDYFFQNTASGGGTHRYDTNSIP